MRAACYTRVSTEEQAREGVSLAAQRQALLAYCRSQSWTVHDLYTDDGYSGKNLERPAVQRMLADAAEKAFHVVLVWKLDRLSRRQSDVLHILEHVLDPAGVGFRSATEAFDTTNPGGRAMLGVLAVFAQLERDTIIERTRMGMEETVRRGKWATGRAPYGYRRTDGGLEVDEDTAPFVRLIFDMAAAGAGLNRIGDELTRRGAPTPRNGARWYKHAVWTILDSRVYVGQVKWRRQWLPGAHPALLSQREWDAANAVRATRNSRPGPRSLLSGIAFCDLCGSKLRIHRRTLHGRQYTHYECSANCGLGHLRAEAVDALVEGRAVSLADDLEAVRDALGVMEAGDLQTLRREDAALAKAEAEARRKIDTWMAAVEQGGLDFAELRQRMNGLEQERANVAARRLEIASALERAQANTKRVGEARRELRDLAHGYAALELEDRRAALRRIVASVRIGPGPTLAELKVR